jgi:hypothetical protein
MDEEHPGQHGEVEGETELPGFGDSFAGTAEDFGSPLPAAPPVKKERRYSGMEIPFGVVETGSNVNELNPMIRGNSKRMSMLRPEHLPEEHHEDVPFGVSGERMSTVGDVNPMRKNSGTFSPVGSAKPFAGDDTSLGLDGKAAGQTNPLRMSGKFKRTPSGSPSKAAQGICRISFFSLCDNSRRQTVICAVDEPVAATAKTEAPSGHKASDAVTELSSAVHIVVLFVYVIFEVIYELAMEAIKPPSTKK